VSPDLLFFGALLGSLGLDVASKFLVQARFILGESLPVLPGVAITYVRNTGAAFSLLADASAWWRRPFFYLVALSACAAAGWMLRSVDRRDRISRLALGLVVGGALGNLVDRVRFGEVVDFIEVGVRGVYTWPVFNVADSAVCVGVGLLVWRSLQPLPPRTQAGNETP
jgi:signal peptidase II